MIATVLAQQQQLFTIAGLCGAVFLCAEVVLLWFRRREPAVDLVTAVGRLVWAATPLAVLLGLALWCANVLTPPPGAPPAAYDQTGAFRRSP